MAQIWMTYDELAELSGCTPAEPRMRAIHLSLDRRKSRDGATRVKLDLALTAKFFASVRDAILIWTAPSRRSRLPIARWQNS